MKKSFIIYILLVLPFFINAQRIHQSNTKQSDKHFTYLSLGYDYGLVTQVGYAHKVNNTLPLWISFDISRPMGEDFLDDMKMKIGGHMTIFRKNNFALQARMLANYRTHENTYVQMKSFGSEFSVGLGLYKESWNIEANLGFDKSIVTQLNHKDAMVQNFPDIQNGWFIPSGGNWFYGIQFGKALFSNFNLSLDLGATNAQGSDFNALLPRYFQLALTKSF